MENENVGLKVGATAVVALLVGGFGGAMLADDQQDKLDELTEELANATAPVTVTEIVEVPVDSENLDLVLKHLYDNKGKVKYLLDDLDDDELEQVVDRVVFVNEATDKAVAYVKGLDFADELEDEDKTFTMLVNEVETTIEVDEDEVKRVRVQDDHDDIVYFDIDFEDSDAYITVDVKFEHNGVKLVVPVTVEIKDNKVEDFEFGTVTLRQ